jgi:drug/metabolite transporter (DMT)-like permease
MTWLIYSLLALTCFIIYDTAGRYYATKSEDPRAFATIYNFFVALMAPSIFLIDQTMPSHLSPWVIFLTIVGLFFWALNGRFEYFAKKHVEASIFAITIKVAVVMSFFLSVIFLKESFTPQKIIGVSLIIMANLLLFIGQKKGTVITPKGLYYSAILVTLLSVAWIFDAVNVKAWGVATFSILSFLAPSLLSGLFPLIKLNTLKRELELTPWWQIVFLGFFNLAGYACMLKAFTLGEASNIIPIVTSTTPFIVLLGVIFLGERNFLARKFSASILTLIAIYLMR